MRGIKTHKILVLGILIVFALGSTGCSKVLNFDKNQNSYITEPYSSVEK